MMSFGARVTLQVQHLINGSPLECLPVVSCIPFRHSYRDRLSAVECTPDIIDRLGGWSIGGVGEAYGDGYPLDVLIRWAENILKN